MSNIYVLWKESSDPPLPWTRLTRQGKYIRLTDTSAYHLVTTGASTHTHTVASFSVGNCAAYAISSTPLYGGMGIHDHPNPSSYSISSANNDPAYYTLDIIYMDFATWKAYHRKFPDGAIVLSSSNIGGAGTEISAYSASLFCEVSGDNFLSVYNTGSWSKITATTIKKVSITSDGSVYAVDVSSDALLKWNGAGWSNLSVNCLEIAAYDLDTAYAIGTDHCLWRYDSGTWTKISTTLISKVSVASDGSIYAVDYTSMAALKWNGSGWTEMGGFCLEIAACNSTIFYAIGTDNCAYRYNSGFTKMSSNTVKKISVTPGDVLYAIDMASRAAIRWNGSGWVNIGGLDLSIVRFDSADGRYIVNNTPGTTGGSNGTRTHTLSATTGVGSANCGGMSGSSVSNYFDHNHTISLSSSGGTNIPRTIETRLYEIISTYASGKAGMVAFCDGTPDGDWEVLSSWKDANLMSNNKNPTISGSDTHSESVSGNSGGNTGANTRTSGGGESTVVRADHTHPISGSFNSSSHVPPSIMLMPIKLNVTYLHGKPRGKMIGFW